MSFISYAQNYEDVMLWRALKHVENGFYIDVGAAWPDSHSVTKAFYDRGWRGINIEPNPAHHASLVKQRTRDINLLLAVGEHVGQLTMNLVGDTGLSTFDTAIAKQHLDSGRDIVKQVVSVDTLAAVCLQNLMAGQEVHFLKVDVEGFEEHVLRSNDWTKYRPWVVVVEATLPQTQQESYKSWEPILLVANYQFTYADGLNRFYVAKEHASLASDLQFPPNVFDSFVLVDQERAVAKAQQSEAKAQQAEAKAQQAEVRLVAAETLLHRLIGSRSWKVTAPLRLLGAKMRWLNSDFRAWVPNLAGNRPRIILKRCIFWIKCRVENHAVLMHMVSLVILKFPRLKEFLKKIINKINNTIPIVSDSFIKSKQITSSDAEYSSWIEQNSLISKDFLSWSRYPNYCLSIILPYDFYDINKIDQTISSLKAQGCPNWQLFLAPYGDAGMPNLKGRFATESNDVRIFSCVEMRRRGEALRAAAAITSGEIILVLEPGDVLPEHAISTFITLMGDSPELLILYADEDVIEFGSRRSPQLKPSWSPELLRSYNYFGRPTVIRKSALTLAGSFSTDAGVAAEWDLWIRVCERFMDRVSTPCIGRATQVLCHRHPDSNNGRAPNDIQHGEDFKECLRRHWARFGKVADIFIHEDNTLSACWDIENPPLVSIIIPNKNRANLLNVCLEGLWKKTVYPRIEIIVVDNGSTEQDVLELYAVAALQGVRVVDFNESFNYSRACNRGAAVANGDLMLFLNNDIEVIQPDWLTELVRHAMLPGVGVVGTNLVYPDGVLQHAGVVLGMHVCGLVFHRGEEFGWGPFGSPSVTRNWMGIMGACQLIRRSVFDRIGGFDETYQIAMSDIKLSIDAWRAGYRTVNAPKAKLIHHEGASRGKSNPRDDIVKTIKDIYAKGLEVDGYFHPGLSAIPAVPTLRRSGEPSTVESLDDHYATMVEGTCNKHRLDLFDDRFMARASGLLREQIFWMPDPAGVIDGPMSAARFMIELLRARADIRERFPLALSGGAHGDFAIWLKDEALSRFGFSDDAACFIDAAFNQRLGVRARQAILFEYDLRDKEPLLFLHDRADLLVRSLFGLVVRGDVLKESAWWLLLELNENPARALVESWQQTPIWQKNFPNGITRFGRENFANWVKEKYSFEDVSWLQPSSWPDFYPAADQVRLAYLSSSEWQIKFPQAMNDIDACQIFLEFLNSQESNQSSEVIKWLSTFDKEELPTLIIKPGVNIFGHFSYPSGLRTSAESVDKALTVHGFRRSLINVPVSLKNDETPTEILNGVEVFDISIVHVQPEPFFHDIHRRSNIVKREKKPYQIGYWYWEFESIPSSWDKAAEMCDELWTATEFIAKGLRERYRKPVNVFFPGIELPEFKHFSRSHYGIGDNAFVFLFVFHMTSITERKNPLGLMRAFKKAFGVENNPPLLIIKTSFGSSHPTELQRLMDEARGVNIHIIDEVFTTDETLSLMDVCDAYISLHRSEGLGLTMAEAMLLGKPTIASRFSGNLDFMDDNNSLLVDCERIALEKKIPPYSAGLIWADPSEDQAAEHMRTLFDDRQFARDLGIRAKEDIERRLNYEATGKRMAERISLISSSREGKF